MIKTLDEFNAASEFINKDLETYSFDLSEQMNSYEYNLYLQDTQYYIDVLYEKTRTIEDMMDYLEKYCIAKINKINQIIKQKETLLNSSIDKRNNKDYTSLSIDWEKNPVNEILDRDGSLLYPAKIKNDNGVEADFVRTPPSNIIGISKTSNNNTYSDNLSEFMRSNIYYADYILDHPNEIIEEFCIDLDNPTDVNNILIDPINCDVYDIGFDENNRLNFKLNASNYSKIKENFDYDNYKGSFLNSINELDNEYNSSKGVFDNQSSLMNTKNTYNKYLYIDDIYNNQELRSSLHKKSSLKNDTGGI